MPPPNTATCIYRRALAVMQEIPTTLIIKEMEIYFRRANLSDFNQILILKKQIHDFHYSNRPDFYKASNCPLDKKDFENLLSNQDNRVFIVENKKQICGYAFVKIIKFNNDPLINDHNRFYIDDICVDENLRGKSIGQFLMKKLELECKSLGLKYMDLSVWSFNSKALNFYRKFGMKESLLRVEKRIE